eukprot:scaffold396_cov352-Pavlova_lutheri.AAC.2
MCTLLGWTDKPTMLIEGNNIGSGSKWSLRLNLSERNGLEAHLGRALDFEPKWNSAVWGWDVDTICVWRIHPRWNANQA